MSIKTKGMQLLFGKTSSASKVDPCVVCGEQVGCKKVYTKSEVGSLFCYVC